MKTTKRNSRIVVATLLIAVLLFSAFAVTSFATDADPDISGITFNSKMVEYDGAAHSIEIEGTLPDGVTVTYSEPKSAVGTHVMTAFFSKDGVEFATKTAVLIILPENVSGVEFSHIVDGAVVFEVIASSPLGEGVTLSVNDKSADYENYDFSSLTEKGKITYGAAYDISLLKDGAAFSSQDISYTVRLYIPSEIRNCEGVTVVHISDDNKAELVETTRDGNYVVFETDHFSVYSVIDIDTTELNLLWLWILLGVVAVIAAIIAVAVIINKRGKKGKTDANEDKSSEKIAETKEVKTEKIEETSVEETAEAPAEEAAKAPAEEAPAEEAPAEKTAEEAATVETAAEATVEKTAENDSPVVVGYDNSLSVDGNVVFIRFRSSFTARLIQSEKTVQDYYTTVKNYLLSYKKVKSRVSFNFETFNRGRIPCARLNIKGKTLYLNLALNPAEYNVSKYHFIDMSETAKFVAVPMLLKVKSERSLKYALELIDEVMKAHGIKQGEIPQVDYHMPYQTNSQLAMTGLVKVILPADAEIDENTILREANLSKMLPEEIAAAKANAHAEDEDTFEIEDSIPEIEEETVEEAPAAEETPAEEVAEEIPAEEAVAEEPAKEESAEQTVEEAPGEEAPQKAERRIGTVPVVSADDSVMVNGEAVSVRYRSSFTSRLIQSDSEVQDYYTTLKNYLLSFKGVKARTSFNYEAFNKGRIQCVRLNVKGKALTVNLALAPANYNINKYHFTDMSDDPRYDKLPMLLKVRSERALKYAIELIDELMRSQGIAQGKVQNVDYHMPYEPNCELAKRGLVKLILPKGVRMEDVSVFVESDVSEVIASDNEEN